MKAIAVFPAERALRLIRDFPEPSLDAAADRDTAVKLRMLEVGVCGTDREITNFEYGTPPDGADFLVLGHESLAEVVEVGPAVTNLRVGDLAVLMVRRPCPHAYCRACRSHRQDFCFTGDYTERGIMRAHGFLTEFVVDDERFIVPAPRELRPIAVLTEPLTIAEKALVQIGEVQQRLPWGCPALPGPEAPCRHRALVLGSGPVGLLGAMTLCESGFETHVFARARNPARTRLLETIGGTYWSGETTPLDDVIARIGNIDLVFEAAGASKVAFDMLARLGTNGVFVFTGVPGRKAPIQLDADRIMRQLVLQNQVVFGTVNAPRDAYTSAISRLERFANRWPTAVHALLTGRYRMEEFASVIAGAMGGVKNVIRID